MNKTIKVITYILTALIFLVNSILWWPGSKIAGILLIAAALFFGMLAFVQIKKPKEKK